jgi:hypothetical protein
MNRPTRISLAVLGAAILATAQLGCEEIPSPYIIECGDLETFQPEVSNVLEKRCGTLDCHGTLARPLRIYGQGGLRLAVQEEIDDFGVARANGTVSGGKGTTEDEYEANWRSVCGLEPETWQRIYAGEAEPIELLVLSKPIGPDEEDGTTHKGGAVLIKGGVGFDCIRSWVEGEVDVAACLEATEDL